MARIAQEGIYADFDPPISELRKRLATFGPVLSAKYLGSALRQASEPALKALKQQVDKRSKASVTGNLKRAISAKVKRYSRTGNAVALIGFAATSGKRAPKDGGRRGKDQAFHAGLVEFGTKNRKTKGNIASSVFSKSPGRGLFEILPQRRGRGKGASPMLFVKPRLKPAYPKAFFKRAPKGMTVDLGSTPAFYPIKNAWNSSKSQVEQALGKALQTAVKNAARDLFAP
jgi:hypothetical protein